MSKIKICGLSRVEDVEAVNRALPDYIGFVFARSRRRVTVETAAMLKAKLDSRIAAVGVFVNETIEAVADIYRSGIIDIVQLHGDEGDEYIWQLKEMCGCCIIKAIGIGGGDTAGIARAGDNAAATESGIARAGDNAAAAVSAISCTGDTVTAAASATSRTGDTVAAAAAAGILQPAPRYNPDFLLFDALSSRRGGAGKAFDWSVLKDYRGLPYFLAGGLTLNNVGEAIRLLSPYCVDVSSGVETDGRKDAVKIEKIVRLVRGALLNDDVIADTLCNYSTIRGNGK